MSGDVAARPHPVVRETLDIGRQRLSARHVEGAPVGAETAVLVHGLGQSTTDWLGVLPLLGGALDAWALDLPGHGDSPAAPDGDYTPTAHARALVAAITRLGAPVHLAGNSLGGLVALIVAARRPDLVRTLTLVSPALPRRVPTRNGLGLMVLATPRLGDRLAAAGARRPPERRARELLEIIFAEPSLVTDEQLAALADEIATHSALPHAGPAFLGSLRGLVRTHLLQNRLVWQLGREVSAPVLVLYGGQDKLVSANASRRARRAFPGATVRVDPTAGHIPQREHPEVFADLFLAHTGALPRAQEQP
jgi:pimeloyl-ACP methyl ester carboxylesterase